MFYVLNDVTVTIYECSYVTVEGLYLVSLLSPSGGETAAGGVLLTNQRTAKGEKARKRERERGNEKPKQQQRAADFLFVLSLLLLLRSSVAERILSEVDVCSPRNL